MSSECSAVVVSEQATGNWHRPSNVCVHHNSGLIGCAA